MDVAASGATVPPAARPKQHRVYRHDRIPPLEHGPTVETKAKLRPNPIAELRKLGLIDKTQETAADEIVRLVEALLAAPGVDYATWTTPGVANLPNYLQGLSSEAEKLYVERIVPWTKRYVGAGRIQGRSPVDFVYDCIIEGSLGAQITALRSMLDAYAKIAAGTRPRRKARRSRRLAKQEA